MREALVAVIAAVIVGLSTFFIEEMLFEQEQVSLVTTLSGVVNTYSTLLAECRDDHRSCNN